MRQMPIWIVVFFFVGGAGCALRHNTLGPPADGGTGDSGDAAILADAADTGADAMIFPDAFVDVDANVDADVDAAIADAGPDVMDAGTDAGSDAGTDAGPTDAGSDAGPTDSGPPDAGSPNLIIRYTLNSTPTVLYMEVSPASATVVALSPATCIGGLRVIPVSGHFGVECLYATPLPHGTNIRFNFSIVPGRPMSDSEYLCGSCTGFPTEFVVNYEGTNLDSSSFLLGSLPDGMGVTTRFIPARLP